MSLINFDPKIVGRYECGWWMAHNYGDNEKLLQNIIGEHCELYGFDVIEAKGALDCFFNAIKMQNPKIPREKRDWEGCYQEITKYYMIIKTKTGLKFDPKKAGKMEVDWWILHDNLEFVKDKTPLANAFAKLYSEVFGIDEGKMKKLGELRAKATYEHDLAENTETPKNQVDKHWKETEKLLVGAYEELKYNLGLSD